MKRWKVPMVLILVLCASLLPAAAESPAVMGILEIRGLDALAGAAFELSKAAGEPTPKEMVSMILYSALGTMPGMGIQPEGTLRALVFESDATEGGVALLLPVENEGADYLSGLGNSGWETESETADGILHLVAPPGAGLPVSEAYFLKRGATLVAGRSADDVRAADAALATLPPVIPVEGDVALLIRPAALVEAFSPQIAEQLDKAFKGPELPPQTEAMGSLYLKTYLAVARQVEEFAIGFGVANGHLNLHTRATPVAGSTLAAWLGTVGAPAAAASAINLPEALAVEVGNFGNLDLLAPAYFRFMDEVMAAIPAQPGAETVKGYLENAKASWAQLAGDYGFALLPPTREMPVRFAEYLGLKDSAAMRSLMREMVRSGNEMLQAMSADVDEPMPFTLSLTLGEPREYRGSAVDKITYALGLDGEAAAKWPEGIPTRFEAELAWIAGGVLVALGDPATTDSLVDRALDGAAPVSDRAAWQALHPTPDANLSDVAHIALFDTIRAYLELVDAHTGSGNAAQVPAGAGDLASASSVALGGYMTRIRISLADIAAIGAKARETREKARASWSDATDEAGDMSFEEEESMTYDSEDSETVAEDDTEEWDSEADAEEEAIEPEEPATLE